MIDPNSRTALARMILRQRGRLAEAGERAADLKAREVIARNAAFVLIARAPRVKSGRIPARSHGPDVIRVEARGLVAWCDEGRPSTVYYWRDDSPAGRKPW